MPVYRLGDICKMQSGGTPAKSAGYYGGDIPWITTVALNGKQIDGNDAVDWITEEAIRNSAAKIVPAYSIMIGTRVGIGKVASNCVDMATNQDIISLTDIDETYWDKQFICKFIASKKQMLVSKARGATIKGIKIDDLASLQLPDWDITKQREVVSVLDCVERLMDFRRGQLGQLDTLIKARFVEMFGDLEDPACKYNRISLGRACKSADDIKCGPFGTQLNKDEYQSEGVAVWEIPQINSEFDTRPTHFLTAEKAEQLKAYTIESGDIAMSRKGNVGRCAVFPEGYETGIIHSDVLRIRVDKDIVNPVFMMYQLHFSGCVRRQIEMVSSGAIMAGINVTKLKNIEVHMPDYEMQNEFAAFVSEVDKSKFYEEARAASRDIQTINDRSG